MSRRNKLNDVFKHIDMNPIPPSTCWLWKRSVSNKGIPYFNIGGKSIIAYRLVYWIAKDNNWDINNSREVIRHGCTDTMGNPVDNPLCCRPEHLTTGTQEDNMMDMMLRGRRGLTREAVRDILDLGSEEKKREMGLTHDEIGRLVGSKYNIEIARTTVTDILSGRRRLVMRNELDKQDRAIRESGKNT